MGQIGSHKFPEHTIEQCIEIVDTIDEHNITKQTLLADKLGHESDSSGSFRNKLTSLRRYGLIQGRGDIVLSDLARKISTPAPNSNERQKSIGEAVLNVQLFANLYERLDYEPPDNDFWYQLVEVTDVERSEAKNQASKISRLYENGLRYVRELQDDKGGKGGHTDSSDGTPTRPESEDGIGETMSENTDAKLVTENAQIDIVDRTTYNAAKALFEELAKKYEETSET